MIILDSDVIISLFNESEEARRAIIKAIATGETVRTITLNFQEVMFGESEKDWQAGIDFFQEIGVIPYTQEDADKTVKLRKHLKNKGKPLNRLDELIAGTCLANNASILTRNKKHFSKVPGLKVISW